MQFRPQPWFGFARTNELRGSSQPQVRGQKSRARNPMSSLSWQYLATSAQLGAMQLFVVASQNGLDGGPACGVGRVDGVEGDAIDARR